MNAFCGYSAEGIKQVFIETKRTFLHFEVETCAHFRLQTAIVFRCRPQTQTNI